VARGDARCRGSGSGEEVVSLIAAARSMATLGPPAPLLSPPQGVALGPVGSDAGVSPREAGSDVGSTGSPLSSRARSSHATCPRSPVVSRLAQKPRKAFFDLVPPSPAMGSGVEL